MALIAAAEEAQDIAAAFNQFLDPVPEISIHVTALISECYAISSALRELSTAVEDPRYYRDYELLRPDIATVRDSLNYTFQDVRRLFGGLGRTSNTSRSTLYYQVWRELDEHFYQESNAPLCKRLECIRLFLAELTCVLKDGSASASRLFEQSADSSSQPADRYSFSQLHGRIEVLLDKQEARLATTLNNLSLGDTCQSSTR